MNKGSAITKRFNGYDFYNNYLYHQTRRAKHDGGDPIKKARFINLVNIKKCFQPMLLDLKYQDHYFALARADCPCPECQQNLLVVVVFKYSVPTEGDSGEVHCFHNSIYASHESLCD